MKRSLLALLRCQGCDGGELRLEDTLMEDEEVLEGTVHCEECGRALPVTRGILRAVATDEYVDSFSYQWQLHRKTQLDTPVRDQSERTFHAKTGVEPESLDGLRVLDVGVGTGRFADVVERGGAEVIGVDLSFAVETAMENVGRRARAHVIQADCFDMPLEPESFDLVYSIGVLHHTPDCRAAFLSLVPYVKPGGRIAIWVYDAHVWRPGSILETVNRAWRSVTSRLPHRLLYALCTLELPYYYLRKIPGFELALHLVLPGALYHAIPRTNDHPRVTEHLLDTFDWYSPRYQSKHTYPEVFSWFEEAGLEQIRILPSPVAVVGRKPEGERSR